MNNKRHLTIMILEDNRADVYLLKEALQRAGMDFTAIVFGDGESAFHYIDAAALETGPALDIAILDLNTPKRDGSEVLAHLREYPKLRHIPVVIFSSSPKGLMRSRTAQANCYITKPNDLEALLKIGEEIRDCVQSVSAVHGSTSLTSTAV